MIKRNEIIEVSVESKGLQELRELKGLSIRKLAVLVNLSPTRVHQMEQGRGNITEDYLRIFLGAVGMTLSEWEEFLNNGEIKVLDLRDSCIELIINMESADLDKAYEYLLSCCCVTDKSIKETSVEVLK